MGRRRTNVLNSGTVSSEFNIIDTNDKATRRVIAPYLKIVRKSDKTLTEKQQETSEHRRFNFYIQNKPTFLLQDFTSYLADCVDLVLLLQETSDVLKSTTNATGKLKTIRLST